MYSYYYKFYIIIVSVLAYYAIFSIICRKQVIDLIFFFIFFQKYYSKMPSDVGKILTTFYPFYTEAINLGASGVGTYQTTNESIRVQIFVFNERTNIIVSHIIKPDFRCYLLTVLPR